MARRLPLRIVLNYRGVSRKFVTVIVGKDNSLYIHQNRPLGQPWRMPRVEAASDASARMILDFKNFEEPTFELAKLTIHQSGFIHTTDRRGKRYKEGTRGPSFAEMQLPYDMCVLVPCDPELLPPHQRDRAHVAQIELPDDIRPFHLTLSVIASSAPPLPVAGPLLPRQPLNFLFEGLPRGIALTLWPVKPKEPGAIVEWPPFPFVIVRTAA